MRKAIATIAIALTACSAPVADEVSSMVVEHELVESMRTLAANYSGTTPDAPITDIQYVAQSDLHCGSAGCWLSTGVLQVNSGMPEKTQTKFLIHEIAHALTPGHGHDATWCEFYYAGMIAYGPNPWIVADCDADFEH